MRHRRARFLVAPLIAVLGLIVLASPAGASGESVGGCMAEIIELADHDGHLDEDLLHDESFQKELEKCFDAPKMIFPEFERDHLGRCGVPDPFRGDGQEGFSSC